MNPTKTKLITLLQNAHAGEKAAAYAYRGHSESLDSDQEVEDLKRIENEEWDHRERLGKMLSEMGSGPRPSREFLMSMVGKTISFLCVFGGWLNAFNFGWFMSMYGAGKLERGNIVEYEVAARFALEAGYPQFVASLLEMAEIEWDHELYFRNKSVSSAWIKYFPIWPPPSAREFIQSTYHEFARKIAIMA